MPPKGIYMAEGAGRRVAHHRHHSRWEGMYMTLLCTGMVGNVAMWSLFPGSPVLQLGAYHLPLYIRGLRRDMRLALLFPGHVCR